MTEIDWQKAADAVAAVLKGCAAKESVASRAAVVSWKRGVYGGTVQPVKPEYDYEIVLLGKTVNPLDPSLAAQLLSRSDLDHLVADDGLLLGGTPHIVRLVGDRLSRLAYEQSAHMQKYPFRVAEVDGSGSLTVVQVHLYDASGEPMGPGPN